MKNNYETEIEQLTKEVSNLTGAIQIHSIVTFIAILGLMIVVGVIK